MSNFSRGISTFTGMITWFLLAGLLQRASDYYVIISDIYEAFLGGSSFGKDVFLPSHCAFFVFASVS